MGLMTSTAAAIRRLFRSRQEPKQALPSAADGLSPAERSRIESQTFGSQGRFG